VGSAIWSPHGLYMESPWSPCKLYVESMWTLWSLHGLHGNPWVSVKCSFILKNESWTYMVCSISNVFKLHYPNRQVIYMVKATMCNSPWPTHVVWVHVALAHLCGMGTITPLANIGWPIWIGPLSSQLAHMVWAQFTERCDG